MADINHILNKNTSKMDAVFDTKIGAKLALLEKLRTVLGEHDIECPGIVVIGAQSAGKSSVLESITKIPFPTAENTCTRVPTVVQLQACYHQSQEESAVHKCGTSDEELTNLSTTSQHNMSSRR